MSAYVAVAVRAPVDCEPFTGLVPDQAPEAVQEVALVEVQVNVELPPLATVLGLAPMFTVAVFFALTVTFVDWAAVPPSPLQLKV